MEVNALHAVKVVLGQYVAIIEHRKKKERNIITCALNASSICDNFIDYLVVTTAVVLENDIKLLLHLYLEGQN